MNANVTCTGDSILIKSEPQWQYNDGDDGIKCEDQEEEMLEGISLKQDLNGSLKQEVLEDEGEVQFDEGCQEERQQVVKQEPGDMTTTMNKLSQHDIEYKEELLEGVSIKQETLTSFMSSYDNETEVFEGGSAVKVYGGDNSFPQNGDGPVVKQEILPPLPAISSPDHRVDQEFIGEDYSSPMISSSLLRPCFVNMCDNNVLHHSQQHLVKIKRSSNCVKKKRMKSQRFSFPPDCGFQPKLKIYHHRDTMHKCESCNYSAASNNKLVVHKRTHTGKKPHRCDKCPYAAAQAGHLVRHKRTHTGEKPYRCRKCPYATARADVLVIHERTHTGEKPYMCDKCP